MKMKIVDNQFTVTAMMVAVMTNPGRRIVKSIC
jgi:hypothetical protein